MTLESDFQSFLHDIEPSPSTIREISTAQNAIREYLLGRGNSSAHYLDTYLSGSYAKRTSIRPASDDGHRDVDVIVETDYDIHSNSCSAITELRDVLRKEGKYSTARLQHHSVGVTLSRLDIDIVPLAKHGDEYFIGSTKDESWKKTNPKGHLAWATTINQEHDGKFKPLVKIFKWWRHVNCPANRRWPKGITLEKIIADNLPDSASEYGDLVIEVMENIIDTLGREVESGQVPVVEDPVLAQNNLSDGYTNEDYQGFVEAIEHALEIIQVTGSCNESWRKILGDRFPARDNALNGRLISQDQSLRNDALRALHRKKAPWKFAVKKPGVNIIAKVTFPDGTIERISNDERVIPKECEIEYGVLRPLSLAECEVKWQVVNTGEEARREGSLRGGFETANLSRGGRREQTKYKGLHYVQCFILRKGYCVAYSKEFFIHVS